MNIHELTDWRFGSDDRQARFLACVGVDARDHAQEDAVWMGVSMFHDMSRDDFPVMNRACPCYGEKTKNMHIRYLPLKPGEWQRGRDRFNRGDGDWIENPWTKLPMYDKYHASVPFSLMWEANTYRSLRDNGWNTEIGLAGCQTLFDDLPEILVSYAEQQCSMVPSIKSIPGSDYKEWELRKPQLYDKEFFDTNSGSWMIASYVGMNPEMETANTPQEENHYDGGWIQRAKNKAKERNSVQVPQVRGRSLR